MNNGKHTPGPWRAAPAVQNNGPDYYVIGPRGWQAPVVAHAWNADDAALLAAAPDMLAALADAYRIVFETPREQVDAAAWQAWAAEHSRALRAIAERGQ